MNGLTPRQNQLLDFLKRSLEGRGFPPTYREIMVEMKVASTNAVSDHLRALARKGFIEQEFGRHRGIRLRLVRANVGAATASRARNDGLPYFEGRARSGRSFVFVAPVRDRDGATFFPPTALIYDPTTSRAAKSPPADTAGLSEEAPHAVGRADETCGRVSSARTLNDTAASAASEAT